MVCESHVTDKLENHMEAGVSSYKEAGAEDSDGVVCVLKEFSLPHL